MEDKGKWLGSKKFLTATRDTLFHDTVAGRHTPSVYRFFGIEGSQVRLERLDGSTFLIDGDDRYGRYPCVTQQQVTKLEDRLEELRAEVKRYEAVLYSVDTWQI